MNRWETVADEATIERASVALKANGITAMVVETGEDAKKKVFELIPEGAQVMNMTSVTLDSLGISKEILESGKYASVRGLFSRLDQEKDYLQKQQVGAAPEFALGSVHAVTEDGKVVVASNTGSQLPAYAYGSPHVIWVVGAHKIVKNLDEAMKRVYDYVLPLEADRARKAYGISSAVSKLLIINREVNPNRLTLIFVKEKLGF